MKTIFLILSAVLFISNAIAGFSQTRELPDPEKYFYSLSNGDISNPMPTTVQPEVKKNPEKERLLALLREARLNNNTVKAQQYQAELDRLNGYIPTEFINNPEETGMLQTTQQFFGTGQPPVQTDAVSSIANAPFWGLATQTSSKSSAVFTAVSEYIPGGGDKIAVWVSYDHGATWIKKGEYNSFSDEVDCRSGEVDVEPVISGADTMVFVTCGYTFNDNAYSFIGRFNIGTGVVTAQAFSFHSATSHNYDPRVTSDNTNYAAGTYVYITVANDSALSGGNRRLRQRFCVIGNPFAPTFTQTHRMANTNGGGSFFWFANSAPVNTRIYQDVGFYNTGTADRVYTTVIYSNSQNVFNAWSDDIGVTNSGSLNIVENRNVRNARIAFNGGGFNQNGALVYLRDFSASGQDADVKVLNTNTGGITLASFNSSYPEGGNDTATSCDIQAVKLAENKFKFAYSVKGGKCYYTSNTSQLAYTTPFIVNTLPAGEGYGRVRAGYRVIATDSCLAIWSTNTGGGAFSTYGCGITGIQPVSNTIPGAYSLAQNYPNPFNPSTRINFSLPEKTFAKLKIYDILGKEIAVLVNGELNAGDYSYEFNAASLPSGVYLYKLETEKYTAVRRMLLTK